MNNGYVDVKNVTLHVEVQGGQISPVLESKIAEMFPVEIMHRGDEICIETGANFSDWHRYKYNVRIEWETFNGKRYVIEEKL